MAFTAYRTLSLQTNTHCQAIENAVADEIDEKFSGMTCEADGCKFENYT